MPRVFLSVVEIDRKIYPVLNPMSRRIFRPTCFVRLAFATLDSMKFSISFRFSGALFIDFLEASSRAIPTTIPYCILFVMSECLETLSSAIPCS
jgi:hypothetical protein